MASSTAPVALFVYNRPAHTRQTVEALLANELAADSDLFIFSDQARHPEARPAVAQVREYIRGVQGFRSVTIRERSSNAGLAKSIIEGVSAIVGQHGRVIVVEDDLVTSRWFLTYMNQALALYENDPEVASIHGYSFPSRNPLPETFFLRGADCWGWATWERAWRDFESDGSKLIEQLTERGLVREFDLDGAYSYSQMLRDQVAGRNDSWAVRWHATCFLNGKLTLHPGRSLVENIGTDGSGTHSADSNEYAIKLTPTPIRLERIPLTVSPQDRRAFAEFMGRASPGMLRRVWARIGRGMRRSA